MAGEEQFHPSDAVTPAIKATGITGFAGLFVASVQATLTRRNIGALGTFTHFSPTITTFGAAVPNRSHHSECLHGPQLPLEVLSSFLG